MQEFWIRIVSTMMIVGILLGYNGTLDDRRKEEEIARLNAQVVNVQSAGDKDGNKTYVDGTFGGESEGFGGKISVEVLVKNGEMKEINITSAEGEDGAYLAMAKDIIPNMIKAQSSEVDTISGATFSSTGIKEAVKQALEKAVQKDE